MLDGSRGEVRVAHTTRCENATGPAYDCHCSCGGMLHGGVGQGRWWRPIGNAVRSGMAPIPSPRGADLVQAAIGTLYRVHVRDRTALRKIHSAIAEPTRRLPNSHGYCTLLVELARDADEDRLTDEFIATVADLNFASTFAPSPATVLRIAALLWCPDPARHTDLERDCLRPLARELAADAAV